MRAVIPFSKGLDSRSVAGLISKDYGSALVRIQVGSDKRDKLAGLKGRKHPFTSIPYQVTAPGRPLRETSARSRGFKFAMVSAIAAYLAGVDEIIVPESGQGALGPALLPVGHAYEDYRNHPLFMRRMESLVDALFDHRVHYSFPRLWFTKGETLRAFISECEEAEAWERTWSCWQQSRQVSVNGRKRQCGICAACMLRRLSVHAAGLSEASQRYVWEDLRHSSFEHSAADGFPTRKITGAMREYAIAGALHMEHLAALAAGAANDRILSRAASQLARAEAIEAPEALRRLRRVVEQHAREWRAFSADLGPRSFLKQWLRAA
jgi:7-cyano-7-deazaguanine synthase in queuosine biosynthesis